MRDLDELLRPDVSLAATEAAQPFDYLVIERRAAQRRRGRSVISLAAAAAVVATAVVVGQELPGSRGAERIHPLEEPSARPIPAGEVELEPGTYQGVIDESAAFPYTITFPAGWSVQGGNEFSLHRDSAHEIGILPFVVDEIYSDACQGFRGPVTRVGPRPDDLVTALLAQEGPVKSTPVKTTLGGYPATRIDLRIPDSLKEQNCFGGPRTGVQLWLSRPDRYMVLPDFGIVSVYVVDVDGRRQVFTAGHSTVSSQADRDQLQQVIDSIRIQK